MRILAALLCVGLAGCMSQSAMRDQAHESTLRLGFTDGSCSGTVIGPHAILGATHCFTTGDAVSFWWMPHRILKRMDDGHDHTIVIVDQTFTRWAALGKIGEQGQRVYMYGNPGELSDQYRIGHLSGDTDADGEIAETFDIRGWLGDSGAALFDRHGRIVAVVSFLYTMDEPAGQLTMMGAYPMHFSPEQLARAAR